MISNKNDRITIPSISVACLEKLFKKFCSSSSGSSSTTLCLLQAGPNFAFKTKIFTQDFGFKLMLNRWRYWPIKTSLAMGQSEHLVLPALLQLIEYAETIKLDSKIKNILFVGVDRKSGRYDWTPSFLYRRDYYFLIFCLRQLTKRTTTIPWHPNPSKGLQYCNIPIVFERNVPFNIFLNQQWLKEIFQARVILELGHSTVLTYETSMQT